MKYDRETLLKSLREEVLEIRFIKVNGESRTMRCTLIPEFLPEQKKTAEEIKEGHAKPQNEHLLVVWDIEAKGFRSMRVDSIQYSEVIDKDVFSV